MRTETTQPEVEQPKVAQNASNVKKISRREAARLADCSLSKIKRAISKGSLPSVKNEGARWILYADFIKWLGFDPASGERH
jgi:hypothetical protein